MVRRDLLALMVISAGISSACDSTNALAPDDRSPPGTEWVVSSPAEEGLDPVVLGELSTRLRGGSYPNLHSLLVVRHGRMVFEEYYGDNDADELHTLQSVSKSVASLLVGIAIEEGAIASVDQKVLDFFPEYGEVGNLDAWKRELTIEDLLTMRTGFEWYESPYAGSPLEQLNTNTDDWVEFMLDLAMAEAPGGSFNYNTGGVVLLAGVLARATGMPADTLAERYLFEPLGIETHSWIHGPRDLPHMGGGLYLRPRDMAKLGQMVLDGGRWDGGQVVPPEWIERSLRRVVKDPWHFGDHVVDYGYLWWLADLDDPMGGETLPGDIYVAAGARGQWIFVVPEYDIVVVATGWEHGPEWVAPVDLLYTSILRAVI